MVIIKDNFKNENMYERLKQFNEKLARIIAMEQTTQYLSVTYNKQNDKSR